MGLDAVAIETGEDEVRGINSQAQLAEAEAALQRRLRTAALEAGVTMAAPETVYLAADTKLGSDVTIEHGACSTRRDRRGRRTIRPHRKLGCGRAHGSDRTFASATSSRSRRRTSARACGPIT